MSTPQNNQILLLPETTLTSLFPMDQLIKHRISSEETTLDKDVRGKAMDIICDTLYAEDVLDRIKFSEYKDSFSDSIDWKWKNNRGTLPKRIASAFYQLAKEKKFKTVKKLSDKTISQLGTTISKGMPSDKIHYIDFTKQFNWVAGQFGDNGSCFLSSDRKTDYVKHLEDSKNVFAIRFFTPLDVTNLPVKPFHWYEEDDKIYYGIARAWIILEYNESIKSSFITIFNAYGHSLNYITKFLETYTHWVTLATSRSGWGCKELSDIPIDVETNMYVNGNIVNCLSDNKYAKDSKVTSATMSKLGKAQLKTQFTFNRPLSYSRATVAAS